jgi:hypothetical protein
VASAQDSKSIKTVEDAFDWFEANVARVDEDENQDAKQVHPEVRRAVCAELPIEHHFLSGSYGRRVQAVRLKDIDIIVELNDEDGAFYASASGTLKQVQRAVAECELVRLVRPPSVRSVKAFLHDYEFHVDIVPAIRPAFGEGLQLTRNIPDEGYDDWSLEYPEQQLEACQEKNNETNGLYRPATRVVRAWNQRYPTSKPLRSYHAEALLYHAMSGPGTYVATMLAFFDHAYNSLAYQQLTPTPGAPAGRYVDDRLSAEERETAKKKVEAARAKAHEAADIEEPVEAMEAWVKVFGESFPAPSTQPTAIDEALRAGNAFAVGGGVRVGRTKETREFIPRRSWRRS